MRLRSSFSLGVVALTVIALAAQGVVIKRTPKVGDKANYKISGKFEVMGAEATVSGTAVEEVTAIEGDKVTSKTVSNSTVDVMGQQMAQPETVDIKTEKLDGTYVESKSNGKAPGVAELRLAHLAQTYLPGTPTAIDATWTLEGKKDEKLGTPGYKIDYKYVGDEKVGDVETYKITAMASETTGDQPSKIKITTWLAKSNGDVVKTVQEMTDVVMSEEIPPLSGKMEIIRQ